MTEFECHGGLIIDEMKLAENFAVKGGSGKIDGFVDLGPFTPEPEKTVACDHGLVILFQPLSGSWHQILGVFASRGNVKAPLLSKIILEATLLAENAGLRVDYVTCDGASWNRAMWRQFGISGSATAIKPSAAHPVGDNRRLFFFSDFPHLVKCIRNGFIKTGYKTPRGHVDVTPIKIAHELDKCATTLKVMPKITDVHVHPNNFEKMKVNLAFHLFSLEVLRGLFFYKRQIVKQCSYSDQTEKFVDFMHKLIDVMTSRVPSGALKPNSKEAQLLNDTLEYINKWEACTEPSKGGFLSPGTAEGLRVSLKATLELLEYLAKQVGFKYLLTSRLSQDPLEKLFGVIRQFSGCNDHPTSAQFLTTVNCLAFYNLVKPPDSGNTAGGTLVSLVGPNEVASNVDNLIDAGKLEDASSVLDASSEVTDHIYPQQTSDARLVYYLAGYVARRKVLTTKCQDCFQLLLTSAEQADKGISSFTSFCDRGGLLYPSRELFSFIEALEDTFTLWFSWNKLHKDSLSEMVHHLLNVPQVGCETHKKDLTSNLVKFFIMTRLYFYTKSLNKERTSTREKRKHLKLRRTT